MWSKIMNLSGDGDKVENIFQRQWILTDIQTALK